MLAVALGATAAAAAPTPSPPPGVGECSPGLGIGLLEVPRATLKDPRARNYVVDSVKPGTSFTRKLKVCNGTNNPLKVLLYPDSATISKGSFLLAPGHGTNDLTTWMSVTPDSLTIAPGKAVVATAKFAVPSDAGGGERYGGIVADSPAIGSSGGVALGGRVAIRVYLSVSAGSVPKSDFTVDS